MLDPTFNGQEHPAAEQLELAAARRARDQRGHGRRPRSSPDPDERAKAWADDRQAGHGAGAGDPVRVGQAAAASARRTSTRSPASSTTTWDLVVHVAQVAKSTEVDPARRRARRRGDRRRTEPHAMARLHRPPPALGRSFLLFVDHADHVRHLQRPARPATRRRCAPGRQPHPSWSSRSARASASTSPSPSSSSNYIGDILPFFGHDGSTSASRYQNNAEVLPGILDAPARRRSSLAVGAVILWLLVGIPSGSSPPSRRGSVWTASRWASR